MNIAFCAIAQMWYGVTEMNDHVSCRLGPEVTPKVGDWVIRSFSGLRAVWEQALPCGVRLAAVVSGQHPTNRIYILGVDDPAD